MFQIEPGSMTWLAIRRFIEAERKIIINTLSKAGVDLATTENARGRLAMLEKIENLPTEQAAIWAGTKRSETP